MNPEVKMRTRYLEGDTSSVIYRRETPNSEAELAFALVERWGLVAAEVDGEDAAGRAKMRPCSPQEVVSRAFETAALTLAEARTRGWMVTIPGVAELDAFEAAEKERRKKAKEPA